MARKQTTPEPPPKIEVPITPAEAKSLMRAIAAVDMQKYGNFLTRKEVLVINVDGKREMRNNDPMFPGRKAHDLIAAQQSLCDWLHRIAGSTLKTVHAERSRDGWTLCLWAASMSLVGPAVCRRISMKLDPPKKDEYEPPAPDILEELTGLMETEQGRAEIDAMECVPEPKAAKEPKRRKSDPAVGQIAMF